MQEFNMVTLLYLRGIGNVTLPPPTPKKTSETKLNIYIGQLVHSKEYREILRSHLEWKSEL